MKKTAVIIFNLGGPDKLGSVRKFLFNLFNDRAIINLPNPFRWIIAGIISFSRNEKAKKIYKAIGGKSPLLELTNNQASALEKSLNLRQKNINFRVFVMMRYWHPFSYEVVKDIKAFEAEEALLIPLYPQFSTTTTESSIKDIKKHLGDIPTKTLCCYYDNDKFIDAHVNKILDLYNKVKNKRKKFRILFSAHGLPKVVINKGDPYQWQIEQTAKLIMEKLDLPKIDYKICYQSKVGPMEWLEPTTEEEIQLAVKEKLAIILVPIAFVSEHSETLFELDILYKKIAEESGIKGYYRVDALGVEKLFIEALTDMSLNLAQLDNNKERGLIVSNQKRKLCSVDFCKCINNYK